MWSSSPRGKLQPALGLEKDYHCLPRLLVRNTWRKSYGQFVRIHPRSHSSPILPQSGSYHAAGMAVEGDRAVAGKPFGELKFHFSSRLWESQQTCIVGRQVYCSSYCCALPLYHSDTPHLQQGLLWEIQGIKKIQLASFSLKKYGMDEVALTHERFLPVLTISQCT